MAIFTEGTSRVSLPDSWVGVADQKYVDDQVRTEATTRSEADTALQENIDAEAGTRSQADTALQGKITAAEEAIQGVDNKFNNYTPTLNIPDIKVKAAGTADKVKDGATMTPSGNELATVNQLSDGSVTKVAHNAEKGDSEIATVEDGTKKWIPELSVTGSGTNSIDDMHGPEWDGKRIRGQGGSYKGTFPRGFEGHGFTLYCFTGDGTRDFQVLMSDDVNTTVAIFVRQFNHYNSEDVWGEWKQIKMEQRNKRKSLLSEVGWYSVCRMPGFLDNPESVKLFISRSYYYTPNPQVIGLEIQRVDPGKKNSMINEVYYAGNGVVQGIDKVRLVAQNGSNEIQIHYGVNAENFVSVSVTGGFKDYLDLKKETGTPTILNEVPINTEPSINGQKVLTEGSPAQATYSTFNYGIEGETK